MAAHFLLFSFFTLILSAHSAPTLLQSDYEALLLVHKALGFRRAPPRNACNSAGIFCEQTIFNHSNVSRITRLVFDSNQLNGRISPAIRLLKDLKELSLQNNRLVDQIPAQIAECQSLEVLNLGKNQFSGKIPSGVSSLIRLRVVDLSSNKFVGNLNFLKHFPNLEKLNLAGNMFEGKVPQSLRSFRNLRFVDLSGNSLLEGRVPLTNQLEDLSKHSVDAESLPKRYVLAETSNRTNHISSALAPSSFSSSNAQAPSPSVATSSSHHRHRTSKKAKLVGWIFGFIAGAIAGTISGLAFSMLFRLLTSASSTTQRLPH